MKTKTKNVCPKCSEEVIRNTALGKEFWYCRTCKDEVFNPPVVFEDEKKEEEKQPYLPYFLSSLNALDPAASILPGPADKCPGCGQGFYEDCAANCTYQLSFDDIDDDKQYRFDFFVSNGPMKDTD